MMDGLRFTMSDRSGCDSQCRRRAVPPSTMAIWTGELPQQAALPRRESPRSSRPTVAGFEYSRGDVMLDARSVMASRVGPAGFAFGRFVVRGRQRLLLADGEPV